MTKAPKAPIPVTNESANMNVPCWKSGVFSGISKYALTKNQSSDTIMSANGYPSISI